MGTRYSHIFSCTKAFTTNSNAFYTGSFSNFPCIAHHLKIVFKVQISGKTFLNNKGIEI